ncbi:TCR/Tet family MFS transporter [Marivita sp. XM-24bin2]|jgi:DHA1 family tetracycline resistance protein-like MFS transporter|uniref:TCR/Tet family MFS transporter n=1 Tax=unclassified Marivita TaxID=2632480 RepID=UPI000D79C7D7|nr:TCR/Tet family MFS transporter [Marivita sp. XM-24bin2]MCR9111145.1 TCR/Tet family MFS transporter [Paracoccaceae bacterium]PWL36454.1 MAG: tetracycline resistance MFS efflux pump [Marivita sp. XM-24bin2]
MRLPVVFILITVMIDAMGVGLIIPVMPDLIREVTGGDLANAALWGGVLATVFAVMQFLFGPVIGNLSDRFGRRPVLLISLVVMAADYVVMATAGTMWLLLLGRIVGGITSATQATASAFMADISDPAKKAQNFGLVGAAFGLGFVIGPLMGGLLGEWGTRAPFWAAAALAGANAVFGYFVLQETVTDAIRRPFDWRRANPLGAFRSLRELPGLGRLFAVFFLYQVAFFVYPAVWAYFGQARFGWNAGMIGLSLGLFGIMMAIVQGGLIRLILARLGERGTVIYGLVFDVFAFGALAFVTSGTIALILTPMAALGAVITPALQGIMSKAVGDRRQGELQGALTSVGAVAMIIAPMVMTGVFAQFTHSEAEIYFPGAPFLLSLGLIIVALLVFLSPRRHAVAV